MEEGGALPGGRGLPRGVTHVWARGALGTWNLIGREERRETEAQREEGMCPRSHGKLMSARGRRGPPLERPGSLQPPASSQKAHVGKLSPIP